MDETVRLSLSRRSALLAGIGLAGGPWRTATAAAQSSSVPPVFRTARRQFTLIEPVVVLPQLILTDLAGQNARLGPVAGKVLLINLWATWCDACRLDLPLFERFHQTYGARVAVAAVSSERRDRRAIKDYLTRLSIHSLPIFLDPEEHLASSTSTKVAPLNPHGMPVTYLITPFGHIAGYIDGVADWLSDDAQRLLAYYAIS